MSWQTIDTAPMSSDLAPMDRKRVLLYSPEFGVQFGTAARFRDGSVIARADGFNGEWNITHWMPLPEPPQ